LEPFSLAKGFQTSSNAPDYKSVPPSAEGVKGLCPFETHHLLKKVDENSSFTLSKLFTQTNRLCAVGEQYPASSWFFPL
jgi:hypothetical protein